MVEDDQNALRCPSGRDNKENMDNNEYSEDANGGDSENDAKGVNDEYYDGDEAVIEYMDFCENEEDDQQYDDQTNYGMLS